MVFSTLEGNYSEGFFHLQFGGVWEINNGKMSLFCSL